MQEAEQSGGDQDAQANTQEQQMQMQQQMQQYMQQHMQQQMQQQMHMQQQMSGTNGSAQNMQMQQMQMQQQQLQQQHMQMQLFWQNQVQEINAIDPGEYTSRPSLYQSLNFPALQTTQISKRINSLWPGLRRS
jgi:hypothetical protein